MKAVYITEFGGPDNLEVREVPDPPKPVAGEVIVRVHAAGLNRADLLQRRGAYPPPPGYSPNIPGLEFAGVIAETGVEVQGLQTGDRVFGITAGEAQAEYLKIDHRLLAQVPDSLTLVDAAAVPEAFITAHDAVFTQAGLKNAETLLVHAVGSGVGLAGLQLGKANGHRVIGTSRTKEKLERCREFGLDEAIVVSGKPDFANEIGSRVDVILDLVGGAYFEQNLQSLATKGRLMLVGLTAGRSAEFDLGLALSKRLTLIGTMLRGRTNNEKAEAVRAFARDVVPMLADGRVRPTLDKVFQAGDVRDAYDYLESNESFGKVVLEFES
jgi:putative PIG3 family NAD(P)H quinone oxidoreductase